MKNKYKQFVENLLKEQLNESQDINKIVFDGKNKEEIKKFLNKHGVEHGQEINGRLFIKHGGKEITVFKGDAVVIKDHKPQVMKPGSY